MAKPILNNCRAIYNTLPKLQKRQIRTTVDPGDVYRHSQLMHGWWNLDGPMKPLHKLNALRVPFIRDGLINNYNQSGFACLKEKRILDIGCGGGILTEGLAKLGAKVTGIDASKALIELAQLHSFENKDLANNRPTYICTTIEDHSALNIDKYDAVVASEVIEHVNEKELFVHSCVQTTRPGGKLFFTTPNRTRIAQIYLIFLSEYIFGTIPKGTHQYDKFLTPNELEMMLQLNDCAVDSTRGFVLDPFSDIWKWCNSKLVMFGIEATKCK